MTSNQLKGQTVWLKCDGLDTVATVRYMQQLHHLTRVILVKEEIY